MLIARELYKRPALLLLDEPTSALSPDLVEQMKRLFIELSRDYAVIIVTHQAEIADIGRQIWEIRDDSRVVTNVVKLAENGS